MIIADTNVLSELLRPRPDPRVLKWSLDLDLANTFVTSITMAEVLAGIAQMPEGRRRRELEDAADQLFAVLFSGRILAFDTAAAQAFSGVTVARRTAGRPIEFPDALIAAVCLSQKAAIATRDVGGFEGLGLDIINPWAD